MGDILSKGNALAKSLSLDVNQSLYSDWGNFYAEIKRYPCVLFDRNGYILINAEQDLAKYGIKVSKRTNIPQKISSLKDYVSITGVLAKAPEEISGNVFYEGSITRITVNRYERDRSARKACLDYYGYNCFSCGLNMERIYGSVAANFIHVHHEKPLSEIGENYLLNPISDLKPLCPNCHSIIHLKTPAMTISELKIILKVKKNG